jgi:hypothetical protein
MNMTPNDPPSRLRKSEAETSGIPKLGSPLLIGPTIATPDPSRPNSCTAKIPSSTATSDAGITGFHSFSPRTSTRDNPPTSSVRPLV